jgi:hypothetical protein
MAEWRRNAYEADETEGGRTMTDKPDEDQPTQKTPKGAEIPVPARDDVLRDLRQGRASCLVPDQAGR